jgi:hypothetical protein
VYSVACPDHVLCCSLGPFGEGAESRDIDEISFSIADSVALNSAVNVIEAYLSSLMPIHYGV